MFDEYVTRRRYRLGKRADAAAATHRRIVEATMEAHDELGISGTSVRDIAERAGVAPSTVLHHFPVMKDLIRACGELSQLLVPTPTEAVFVGASGPHDRVRRMAMAMFEWWNDLGPGLDHLRVDRRRIPEVDAWIVDGEQRHRALAAAAIDGSDPVRIGLLVAATSADAWAALRASGLSAARAAVEIANLLIPNEPMEMETVH